MAGKSTKQGLELESIVRLGSYRLFGPIHHLASKKQRFSILFPISHDMDPDHALRQRLLSVAAITPDGFIELP